MTTTLNLEEKVWYRLVKVIYIFFYIVAFLIIAFVASFEYPTTLVDSDKSLIICSNGKSYSAGKHRIGIDTDGSVYSWDEPDARKLCGGSEHPISNQDLLSEELKKRFKKVNPRILRFFDNPEFRAFSVVDQMAILANPRVGVSIDDELQAELQRLKGNNYSVRAAYWQRGSWNAVLKVLGYGFLIVVLTLEIIKRIFLYVAVGQPFFGRRRGV